MFSKPSLSGTRCTAIGTGARHRNRGRIGAPPHCHSVKLMPRLVPLLAIAALTAVVSTHAPETEARKKPADAKSQKSEADAAKLSAAIAGNWRDPKNTPRDKFRNPQQTLNFFSVGPKETVIEITPGGGGWYTEILAPYLRDNGRYTAAMVDSAALPEGRGRDFQQKALDDLKARLATYPAQFDRVQVATFDPNAPRFAEPGTVDTVLTFRNVHNWTGTPGRAEAYFKAFYDALKPGGTLGVVDHRAKPGTDPETMKKSGYLTEALVIKLATDAGFRLDAKSDINANPKDTADHKNGVWTLPPTNRHDPEDAAMYQAIGESDRMTLRFVKPAR
jgi:predicted methyltransferase